MRSGSTISDSQVQRRRTAFVSQFATLGLIIAATLYLAFVFLPGQRSIAATWEEVRDQRRRVDEIEHTTQQLASVRGEWEAVHKYVSDHRAALPKADNLAPVYAEIVELARKSNIELASFLPRPEVPLQSLRLIPVNVKIRGRYRCLHNFIYELEKLGKPLWIEDLEIRPQPDGTSLEGQFLLTIFAENAKISD